MGCSDLGGGVIKRVMLAAAVVVLAVGMPKVLLGLQLALSGLAAPGCLLAAAVLL